MLRLVQFHEGKSSTVLFCWIFSLFCCYFASPPLPFFLLRNKKKTSTATVGVHISQSLSTISIFYPYQTALKIFWVLLLFAMI